MSMTAEKIMTEALGLPSSIRAFVAERLIESLDIDNQVSLSAEWNKEIEKRCREIDQGLVELIPADKAFEKAFAKLS